MVFRGYLVQLLFYLLFYHIGVHKIVCSDLKKHIFG